MQNIGVIFLSILLLLGLVLFSNCSKNPLESTVNNEISGIENALTKVGSDLNENEADIEKLQKRLRNAIDKEGKLLRRIHRDINDQTPHAGTRYLKAAISSHNKAVQALKNGKYLLAIKYFKLANRMAAGAINIIKTDKSETQRSGKSNETSEL